MSLVGVFEGESIQKFQIANHKQITITKIKNPKPVWVIDHLNLEFICNLVLVI
jgi:hypothetical protein